MIVFEPTFDSLAHAAYIQIAEAPVASTVEVTSQIYVDMAADGRPVGIELLGV